MPKVFGRISRRAFLKRVQGLAWVATAGTRATFFTSEAATRNTHTPRLLKRLRTPVLLAGTSSTAYRDPAAIYHQGWFYLYFTLIRTEQDGIAYSYLAWTKSKNLSLWTEPQTLTPRDKGLDYGSPGDVIWDDGHWVLCLQTYPRPHGERYGNDESRIWTMTSSDLANWDVPQLLQVKGPDVSRGDMGRMIDPFLLADKDEQGKWWCFYKQQGISISWSRDLYYWTPFGHTDAGENPCVVIDHDEYVLFHSPPNGVGIKRSKDLLHWRDEGLLTLGQASWDWAQGRLTAAFVLDLRKDPTIGKALMFFHASVYGEEDPRGGFDSFASIGVAWSDDLLKWEWPRGGS